MLWPLVLPAQITAILMCLLATFIWWLGTRWRWKRGRKALRTLLLPMLLFVPCCRTIMLFVDEHRFGLFHYDKVDTINDFRVERFMPPSAQRITVFKNFGGNGHRARFTISPEELNAWHSRQWQQFGQFSLMTRPDDDGHAFSEPAEFDSRFGDLGWTMPPDCVEFRSPFATNGAHYTVQYSPSLELAFLNAGYW